MIGFLIHTRAPARISYSIGMAVIYQVAGRSGQPQSLGRAALESAVSVAAQSSGHYELGGSGEFTLPVVESQKSIGP